VGATNKGMAYILKINYLEKKINQTKKISFEILGDSFDFTNIAFNEFGNITIITNCFPSLYILIAEFYF
jgi:hypothetical protein